MKDLSPLRFKNAHQFFDWLEQHPEYELGAITLNIDGVSRLITPEMIKQLDRETQEIIIKAISKKNDLIVYPP